MGEIVRRASSSAAPKLRTIEDQMRFSRILLDSGLVPAHFKTAEAVFFGIQLARELGFPPLQALGSIYFVKGRWAIMGNMASSLVRASGFVESSDIEFIGEGDARKCVVTYVRKGDPNPSVGSFSVKEAEAAGLIRKKVEQKKEADPTAGTGTKETWARYPDDMLYWRALTRCLKYKFPDVLMGMAVYEILKEEEDVENDNSRKPTYRVVPEEQQPDSIQKIRGDLLAALDEAFGPNPNQQEIIATCISCFKRTEIKADVTGLGTIIAARNAPQWLRDAVRPVMVELLEKL